MIAVASPAPNRDTEHDTRPAPHLWRRTLMTLDQPTDADRANASEKNIAKMWKFVENFANKSGSYLHPQREITEFLVIGLAKHIDELGRPLCPCNFYEDKAAEAKSSQWVCACEEMQKFKYCH
jgi:ferredoxin-thioredoxin reductase catalytic subunit